MFGAPGADRRESARSPKSRKLGMEALEARQLLSATPLDPSVDGLPLQTGCAGLCAIPVYEGVEQGAVVEEATSLTNVMDELLTEAGQNPDSLSQDFIFNLSSNPSSTYTIYLDFTGNTATGTYWNNGEDVVTPVFSWDDSTAFSNAELRDIYEIWLRVSEDYMPFNVNVTTKEPTAAQLAKSSAGDNEYGVRVCVGGSCYDWYNSSCGGVAYVGSFTWNSDTPAFVFPKQLHSAKNVAEAASHEVGHTLGLSHDGTSTQGYYGGADGWAPIMGVGYSQPLTQWSKGEYVDANNHEDDLEKITSNGFDYRVDDYGDTIAKARALTFTATGTLASGIIERNDDVDFFSFDLSGEQSVITVGGYTAVTNLDVLVSLYDSSKNLIATYDPTNTLYVSIDVSEFAAGTYYMSVEGTGMTVDGKMIYSDYASLGAYTIKTELSSESNDPYEPNDTQIGAYRLGVISETTTLAAQVDPRNDFDYFNFKLAPGYSGVKVTIDYAYASGSSVLKTAFYNGSEWEDSFADGSKTYYALTGDDSLYLCVNASSWKSAIPYRLTITPLENPELTAISLSTSSPKVGLPISAVLPYDGLTATYQWYRGSSAENMTAIPGATDKTYVPTNDDLNLRLKVVATGYGNCYGTAEAISGKVAAQTVWTVASASDAASANPLTLRQALASAADGDRIVFAPHLNGQTISVGSTLATSKSLTIDASALSDGITLDGGGSGRILSSASSYLSVIGVKFANGATSNEDGAALYANTDILELTNCVFTGNSATATGSTALYGGALRVVSGKATVTGCTFSSNTLTSAGATGSGGGAIASDLGTTLAIVNSSLYGNTSNKSGGAINASGFLSVWGSAITGNTAQGVGGGAILAVNAELVDTLLADNTAGSYGGGIYAINSLKSWNCTVVNNSVTYFGGGIYVEDGSGEVYNGIVLLNSSNRASGADLEKGTGSTLYSINTLTSYTKWTQASGNKTYSPTKPLFTDAENGDYSLPANSQAVDVGDNAYVVSNRDITGNTRVYNSVVDLGAYEYMLAPKPNLLFTAPLGWDAGVIMTDGPSETSNAGTYKIGQDYYVRFNMTNASSVPITNSFVARVFVDGDVVKMYSIPGLDADASLDYTLNLGSFAAGAHTLRVTVDSGNSVDESNENDNVYEFAFKAVDDDEYEQNDAVEQATDLGTLLVQTYVEAKAGANQNEDWFRFSTTTTGASDSFVRLTYNPAGGVNLGFYLYDSAGNLITESGTVEDGVEEISLTSLSASAYYLRVVNTSDSEASVPYVVMLQPPAPPKPDITQATPPGWESPIVVSFDPDATRQAPYYYEDQTFYANFAFTNASPSPTTDTFYVEAYLDDVLLKTYTVNGLSNYAVRTYNLELGSLTVGAHMVKIIVDTTDAVEESSETNNTFTQSFTVSGVDDEYEPNDTMVAAYNLGALVETQTLSLWSGSLQNEDWFRFSLPEDGTNAGRIILTYDHSDSADVDLYLYDADGNQVAYSNRATGTELVSFGGLAAGVYYARTFNCRSVPSSVPYEMTFYPATVAKPNLTQTALSTWTDSILVTNSSSSASDAETFFDGVNYYVRFAFTNNSSCAIENNFTVKCYVDDALAKTFEVEPMAIGANRSLSFSMGVLSQGVHTVRVELDTENTVDESNELDNLYAKSIVVVSGEDQFEPNNTIDEAYDFGTIAGYSSYALNAGGGQDEDWYKFTTVSPGDEGEGVTVTYAHVPSQADVDLYLYDAFGKLISSSRLSSGVETVSLAGLPVGTYYLNVYNYFDKTATVPYTLEFNAPGVKSEIPAFDAVATSPFDAVVSIGAIDNATGYAVQYATDQAFSDAVTLVYTQAGDYAVSGLAHATTYYFRAKASTADLPDSPWSQVVAVTTDTMTQLDAPTVSAAANGSSEIVVTVGAVAGAEAYTIEYSTDAAFAGAVSVEGTAGKNTISGLNFETTYYVRVKATAVYSFDSEWAVADATTTKGLAAPELTIVSVDSTGVKFSYAAVENASFYRVQYSKDPNFRTLTTKTYSNASAKSLSGLANETTYYLRVKAVANGFSDSEWATASFTTTLDPNKLEQPDVTVVATGEDYVKIEFDAVPGASFYRVQYSLNASFSPLKTKTYSSAGVKTISGLLPDDTYYIRVKSYANGRDDSNWTVVVANTAPSDARLGAPALTVVPSGADAAVCTVGAVDSADAYTLEYATNASFTNAKSLTVDSGKTTVSGLASNTTYYFRAKATGEGYIASKWSATASATTGARVQLDAPTFSVEPGSTSAKVTIDASDKARFYRVQYSTDENFKTLTTKTYSSAGAKTVSGLIPGQTYYFRVKATASGYADSAFSYSYTAIGETDGLGIKTPSISAIATSSSSVQIMVGSVKGAAQYKVQFSTSRESGVVRSLFVEPGKTIVTEVLPNTTYYFRVEAIDADGVESGWSPYVMATTFAANVSVSGLRVPSISAIATSSSTVQVMVGSVKGAAQYKIQYATVRESGIVRSLFVAPGKTVVSDLASSHTYYFRVEALDATGRESGWSPYVAATTFAGAQAQSETFAGDGLGDDLEDCLDVLAESLLD